MCLYIKFHPILPWFETIVFGTQKLTSNRIDVCCGIARRLIIQWLKDNGTYARTFKWATIDPDRAAYIQASFRIALFRATCEARENTTENNRKRNESHSRSEWLMVGKNNSAADCKK
jgi:hypothetical protein